MNGKDVSSADADVSVLYKNDTWVSPSGWSGPVRGSSFTSAGATATLILKSGNTSGTTTGVKFDVVVVKVTGTAPPPANRPPDAVLSVAPTLGQAPLDVSFDASGSTDPDGDPLSFAWTFGDGGQASGVTASHRYTTDGTFTARVTVQDGRGGSDDATASIVVGALEPPPLPPECPPALHFAAIRAQLQAQGKELVNSKIGFHVGPAGNQTGLGTWMRCLDAAKVPFFLKSADSAGQIFEAVQLKAASGVPHVLVYRKSTGATWSSDVPDYDKPAYNAAVEHWERHRSVFPPELEAYKHLIWVETVNEIDKNRSEWLGEFAYHSAQLAMADGFNWAAFGWSSGEPEPEQWRGPKMRQFLELAAQNPTRVAVAIHEYSYTTDNLTIQAPYLVGRFQQLFDAADEMGLERPTVLITEFGWEYQNVPGPDQAMQVDLPWADELYSRFPEIQGAAIWYLGPGFGGISNQAQKLIAPVMEYALQNYYVITKDP